MPFNQLPIVKMASLTTLGFMWLMSLQLHFLYTTTVTFLFSLQRVWVLRTASQFFNELQAKYQRLGRKRSRITSFSGLSRLQQVIRRWRRGRPEN